MSEDHEMENSVIASPETRIRQKGQVTVPREVREALHVGEGDQLRWNVSEHGQVMVQGLAVIPADQRWFWTPEWQAGEREADEDLAAGRFTRYHDVDEMMDDLDRRYPPK